MSNNNTNRAKVAPIYFGEDVVFDGLLLPNDDYAVGVSQVSELFQFPNKHASRDIKALLGKDFQFPKSASELNPKEVNILTLNQFETVMVELAFTGNEKAKTLVRAMTGLSLRQIFADSFNRKLEKDERQAILTQQLRNKVARRLLTDAIRDYMTRNGVEGNAKAWMYRNVTDKTYKLLFGRSCKRLKEDWSSDDVRESLTIDELSDLENLEKTAMRKIDKENMHPLDAVESAFNILLLDACLR